MNRKHPPLFRFAFFILLFAGLGCGFAATHSVGSGKYEIQNVKGQAEPVVLPDRWFHSAFLSPNGRWLLIGTEKWEGRYEFSHMSLIDLENNLEYPLGEGGLRMAWLDGEYAVVVLDKTYQMLHAPTQQRWELVQVKFGRSAIDDDIDYIRGADHIYVIPGTGDISPGTALATTDPRYPYLVYMDVPFFERDIESYLIGLDYTSINPRYPISHGNESVYSPDGKYYFNRKDHWSINPNMGSWRAIYDAETDQEVAFANKNGWESQPLGWAYDSSGVYYLYRPDSVMGSAPYMLYKSLVPGAALRGMPTLVTDFTPPPTFTPPPLTPTPLPLTPTPSPLPPKTPTPTPDG